MQWDSPSCPRVVVKFIFLSIVSCWDIKGPLFVDQRGCCRLLAGPGQERLHLSSTSFFPFLSPFAHNWTFKHVGSTAANPRLTKDQYLHKKKTPCLDSERLSVVMSHLFHLGLDEAPHSWHTLSIRTARLTPPEHALIWNSWIPQTSSCNEIQSLSPLISAQKSTCVKVSVDFIRIGFTQLKKKQLLSLERLPRKKKQKIL